jgi:hypothetical protein
VSAKLIHPATKRTCGISGALKFIGYDVTLIERKLRSLHGIYIIVGFVFNPFFDNRVTISGASGLANFLESLSKRPRGTTNTPIVSSIISVNLTRDKKNNYDQ